MKSKSEMKRVAILNPVGFAMKYAELKQKYDKLYEFVERVSEISLLDPTSKEARRLLSEIKEETKKGT